MLTPENTFNRDEVRETIDGSAGARWTSQFFLPHTAKAQQHVKRTHARTTPMTKTAAILLQCPAAREGGARIVHKDGAANAGRTANAASHLRVHFYVVRGKMRFFAGRTANNLILPTS